MRWPLVILAVGGCDQVFGLDRDKVIVDAPADPDAEVEVDAVPPDAPCMTKVTRPVIADGQLNASNPTLPGNDLGAMNLQFNGALHTVGVFKFGVAGLMPPVAIDLVIPHATHDVACPGPGGCANTCASYEMAGQFRAYAMTSDWTEHGGAGERGATWNCRRGTTSACVIGQDWFVPGATDPRDRDATSVAFASQVGVDSRVKIDPAMWSWKLGTEISFQIVPDFNSGQKMVRAHENCESGTAAAQLILTYCP